MSDLPRFIGETANLWLLTVPLTIVLGALALTWRRSLAIPFVASITFHAVGIAFMGSSNASPMPALAGNEPTMEMMLEYRCLDRDDVPNAPSSTRAPPLLTMPSEESLGGECLATVSPFSDYDPALPESAYQFNAVPTVQFESGSLTEQASRAEASRISSSISDLVLGREGKEGIITVSLIWFDTNDLDLHVQDPQGNIWNFRTDVNRTHLDVDSNWMDEELTTEPVENIRWLVAQTPPAGTYRVFVDHYKDRTANRPARFLVRVLVQGRVVAIIPREITRNPSTSEKAPECDLFQFDYQPSS